MTVVTPESRKESVIDTDHSADCSAERKGSGRRGWTGSTSRQAGQAGGPANLSNLGKGALAHALDGSQVLS
jgi:hypothetical protein